jgi:hypothetical protein
MATFETSKQAVLDRINTLASSSSTTAEDSIYLAKALREAAADIAFVWRGPWTSTYTYVLGDVVQHDGNAYICINAHVAATTFDSASGSWQTMVVGGAQWFTGNTVPANSSGEDGDWFFNSADEKIHNRQSGTWVSIADLGGSIWTSSVGVGTGGEDGDFHFNETTQEISKRSSGTWTVLADLTPLNMSSAEVKTAYEANANTNEFSDAEQTKLAGIEAGSNLIINNNQIANGAGYITVGLPTGGTVGQVVTNTAAGAGNWADAAGGAIKKVSYFSDGTRRIYAGAIQTGAMNFTSSLVKDGSAAETDLILMGTIPVDAHGQDWCGFQMNVGGTVIKHGFGYADVGGPHMSLVDFKFRVTGLGVASNHNITFGWYTLNSNVNINPNGSDNGRISSGTTSTVTVFEVYK